MNIELKEKVLQYIDQSEGEFYINDLLKKLNADFQEIMDICNELIEEGKIEIASWKVDSLNKVPKEKIILDSLFRFKYPISFDDAKKSLNVSDEELQKMIDNYEYKPTLEDLMIYYNEESEQTQKLKEENYSLDIIGELRSWMGETDISIVDEVLEFLMDKDCLNNKGIDLRHHFWERYIKKETI